MFSISKVAIISALAVIAGALPPPIASHFTGSATLYHPDPTSQSACGTFNNDKEFVAGVSQQVFDLFGSGFPNAVCGHIIQVTSADGKIVQAKVANSGGGSGLGDLILSTPAFSTLADPKVGAIQNVTWVFVQ